MAAEHLKEKLERAYGAEVKLGGDGDAWTARMLIDRGSFKAEYEALGPSPFAATVCLAFMLDGLGCARAPVV